MNTAWSGHDSALPDTSLKIVVIGATGVGKSQFIHLLTDDDKIQIGHTLKSRTSNLQMAHYTDAKTGCSVMLIDTPGFDNSEDNITDMDILKNIKAFQTYRSSESQRLDGIIYMHRISDASKVRRVSKNFELFRKFFGDETLRYVCVVTTHWDEADEQTCISREGNLKEGAFLTAGIRMYRHTNTVESAQAIMSELIALPKTGAWLPDQVVRGTPIGETDIDRITKELADLKRQTEEAVHAREQALIAELDAKRKALEERLSREEIQERLGMMVDELRKQQETALAEAATLRKDYEQAQEEARRLREQHHEDVAEQRKLREEERAATSRREEEDRARLVDAEQRVAELQRRMEEIETACEQASIAELDANRKVLEEKLSRTEEIQERLGMTVDELRKQQETALAEAATLRDGYEQAQEEARRLREQVELAEKQHHEDIAEQRKLGEEELAATARKEEEDIARLADAEQKVAELQRRMEEIETGKQNLKDYAEGLMGTVIWIYYVVGLLVVAPHVLGYLSSY